MLYKQQFRLIRTLTTILIITVVYTVLNINKSERCSEVKHWVCSELLHKIKNVIKTSRRDRKAGGF